jgi:hypothetical protein
VRADKKVNGFPYVNGAEERFFKNAKIKSRRDELSGWMEILFIFLK